MLGFAARLLGGAITPVIDQITHSSARLLRKLALFLLAGLCLVVVLIALTVAFDLWISSLAGPIAGALAVAGVYLLVAIIAVTLALRSPASKVRPPEDAAHRAKADSDSRLDAQVDAFAAPLLKVLQSLGLRREQLAVLAGTSFAKQLGPIPLVGLAIVAGFLIGRMTGTLRTFLGGDLIANLMSSDLLASLFGSRPENDPQDHA